MVSAKALPDFNKGYTGQDRIVSNVVYTWGSYAVFFISGFIMPRLIDQHTGQFSLGVWDFCWTFVNYLGLTGVGVGSSVNRYVAKYRATSNFDGLKATVSSVMFIQILIAFVICLVTIFIVALLPKYFGGRFGSDIGVARWVIGTLGASVAVEMAFDIFRGVMTGCHRWDLHNGINAIARLVTVIGMISALSLGGTLRSLAFVHLAVVIFTEIIRMRLAFRICPEMVILPQYVNLRQSKDMLLFGSKTIVVSLPDILILQTCNVLVGMTLGPAALAIFCRPQALVKHLRIMIVKFAHILTPTAGCMQASGEISDMRHFMIASTRFVVFLTFPAVLFLSVFGDYILRIWMGPTYETLLLMIILSLGYFLPIVQQPIVAILSGMNLHGKVGLISLIVIFFLFGVGVLLINIIGWSLTSLALLLVCPLIVGKGVIVPIYACRKLKIPLIEFLRSVFLEPVIHGLVFALCLVTCRILFSDDMLKALYSGSLIGGVVLGTLYWRNLLTDQHRTKILFWINSWKK